MKVVLFCGGLGTRLKEFSETIPKPMVEIGYRPLMWHLMRYYAHFGHKDFILCLGARGDYIKKYFLNYDERLSNDFVLSDGGREVRLYNSDIADWSISFIDTGYDANIGQRLVAVKEHLEGEEVFMANYSDGLTDLDLNQYVDHFYQRDKIAGFLCVKPSQSFHVVTLGEDDQVTDVSPVTRSNVWINGGFFIMKKEVFDYIEEGEDLVQEPFHRLIRANQLVAYKSPGFWACVDTLKEKMMFDEMYARGETPWVVWESANEERKREILASSRKPVISVAMQDRSKAVYSNHGPEGGARR
jgi:glucose-1-phosphate cytidylyltransferase